MKRARILLVTILFATLAHAEVKQSAADSFLVAFSEPVTATPAKAYASIAQIQHWWSDEHTWSGKATNLSLKAEAGGCFCERWKDGSVEHGRVIMALPDRLLRLDAALGPLQEFALKGILSLSIKIGDDGATRLDVEYRVNGASASGLDTFAPKVDAMLAAQVARLVRYIDTGNPEQAAVATPAEQSSDARAAMLAEWARQAAAERASDPKKPKTTAPKSHKPIEP
jgi:uncharacterized protein YndB with AHSA1/START domain